MRTNVLDWIAWILLVIGGLNWGLVGVWQYDAVAKLAGDGTVTERVILVLVGLAAVYAVLALALKGKRVA